MRSAMTLSPPERIASVTSNANGALKPSVLAHLLAVDEQRRVAMGARRCATRRLAAPGRRDRPPCGGTRRHPRSRAAACRSARPRPAPARRRGRQSCAGTRRRPAAQSLRLALVLRVLPEVPRAVEANARTLRAAHSREATASAGRQAGFGRIWRSDLVEARSELSVLYPALPAHRLRSRSYAVVAVGPISWNLPAVAALALPPRVPRPAYDARHMSYRRAWPAALGPRHGGHRAWPPTLRPRRRDVSARARVVGAHGRASALTSRQRSTARPGLVVHSATPHALRVRRHLLQTDGADARRQGRRRRHSTSWSTYPPTAPHDRAERAHALDRSDRGQRRRHCPPVAARSRVRGTRPALTDPARRGRHRGFTVTVDQLLAEKALWIPSLDVYVTAGDRARPACRAPRARSRPARASASSIACASSRKPR